MASFTEKAIKESFLKLLGQRPLNQITIKDIVEDCGINRNSFYYHFQDLPSLLEIIIEEEADRMISEHAAVDSLEECLSAAIDFALKNKRAALHIYNSVNRELFERYLDRICQYIVTEYVNAVLPTDLSVRETDKEILIKFYKCECIGQILEWMNGGMSYDISAQFHRLCELIGGSAQEAFRRSACI